MEIRRRRQQAEKFRIKKRRESLMKVYFARFVAFLIVAAVMMTGVSVLMAIDFFKTEGVPNKITYIYGSDKNKNTVSADTARKNDIIFIDFSEIAEMLSMTVTGDVHKMRFVITSAGEPIFQPTLQSAETETLEETDSQTDTENTDTNANSNTETPADSTEVESAEWVTFEVGTTKAYVNGQEIRLSGESFLVGEKLWIPSDFIDVYMKGVTLSIDDEKGIVEFSRNVISDTNADEETQNSEENQSAIVYESVEFLLKDAGPIDPVSEEGFTEPEIEFKEDLAEYEKYMNPENPDEYLILINVDNPLSSDYVPDDLIDVVNTRKDGRATQQMREAAEKSLEALFLEMHANNITDVSVTSGYRSYDYQVSLFNQRVAMYPNLSEEEARKEAAAVVAIPGTSEHQSGLCVDMHNLASADISFGNTASFTWLSQNAHKFGFILRFPEDKVEITGISYEPWHYRFVGRYHATRIYEMGMCLEEYFEYLGK